MCRYFIFILLCLFIVSCSRNPVSREYYLRQNEAHLRSEKEGLIFYEQRLQLMDKELQYWKHKEADICRKEDRLAVLEAELKEKEKELNIREQMCNCDAYRDRHKNIWKLRKVRR